MKHSKKPAKLASLVSILAVSVLLESHQVHCSSSYIDDYFHPTAKMALNKIQQTFSSSSGSAPLPNGLGLASIFKPNDSINHDKQASVQQSTKDSEPNGDEFVKLNTWKADEAPSSEGRASGLRPPQQLAEVRVNSNESVPEVATTLAGVAKKNGGSETDGDEQSASITEVPGNVISEQAAAEPKTGTSTTTSTATAEHTDDPQISVLDEASIKETENEAVAAVDASIGFGGSDLFGSTTDTCYDEYGNARFCEPDFENIAFERQVLVSSECGWPASRFCTTYVNERNDQIRNCHICDAQHPKKRHPASYLTDMNNSNAPTCWVSAPIEGAPANATDSDSGRKATKDNVTLTLNFDKKYEITYVSMQFCSLKPDSLAIYKSHDFGRTWTPYQFYSSQCSKVYQRPSSLPLKVPEVRSNKSDKFEAVCVDSTLSTGGNGGQSAARIAFSTLGNQHSSTAAKSSETLAEAQIERSSQLQDWMTATNIRITLDRHQTSWIQSSLGQHRQQPAAMGKQNETANNKLQGQEAARPNSSAADEATQLTPLEASLTNPSDTYNYALADLTVGGRCKCNGHASRCVHGDDGLLTCDCRHNTAGRDCERCAPFHHDRPWQRATQSDANPCQPCQCNGHSRKCRFDPELYQLSGKRSGGVCTFCRDNTAGRHCHYCKEGYTRDYSKPMSDKEACKLCDCHPVGSLGRVCNQTTGQCPCKEGVTGLECNRCAPGYQQSSSPSEPCIKLPENDINYEPTIEAASVEDSPANGNTLDEHGGSQEPNVWWPGNSESLAADTAEAKRTHPTKGRRLQGEAAPQSMEDLVAVYQLDDQYYSQNSPKDMAMMPNSFSGARGRRPQPRNQNRGRHNYYAKHDRHRIDYQSGDDMSDIVDEDEQEFSAQGRSNGGGHTLYNQAKRFGGARHHLGIGHDAVGVEVGNEYGSGSMVPSVSHAAPPFDGPNDDPQGTFNNHIQSSSGSMQGNSPRSFRQHISSNNNQQLRGNNRHQSQQVAGIRRRVDQQHLGENSLACANCQSSGKRLRFKQYCQVDYAIKAQTLNMFMSDDWTRFDVEIQDIFKSPSYGAQQGGLQQHNNIQHGENFLAPDNSLLMMQADDPNALVSTNNGTKHGASVAQHHSIPVATMTRIRLKIGSIQTIWVPTEDVACNCPRLQLRTAYLLMGMVDTKENSVTSIQLDRHGVALEWRSTLQERLIKYQRRYSRGRC